MFQLFGQLLLPDCGNTKSYQNFNQLTRLILAASSSSSSSSLTLTSGRLVQNDSFLRIGKWGLGVTIRPSSVVTTIRGTRPIGIDPY